MQALSQTYEKLQLRLPRRLWPQMVMVTVDPERDRPERLRNYIAQFDQGFIGLRGSVQQTRSLAKQLRTRIRKTKRSAGSYSITYSPLVMLLDPNGDLRAFLSWPRKALTLANDYQALIGSGR